MGQWIKIMLLLLLPSAGIAQNLNQAEIADAVESLITRFDRMYIFSEVAEQVRQRLQDKLEAGEYASYTDPEQLASVLTTDVQQVSRDKHFAMVYDPPLIAQVMAAQEAPAEEQPGNPMRDLMRKRAEGSNFGVAEVRIMPGHIGYVKLDEFVSLRLSQPSLVAAMQLVNYSDGLIFDLRDNRGGDPATVAFLLSYLFDSPRQVNSFVYRYDSTEKQFWTQPYVAGEPMPDLPVYVLTGQRTFSAAEEFAYDLQAMHRGEVVGVVTRGGANPIEKVIVNDQFIANIPTGRAVNPYTHSNWEGVGVQPDHPTDQDDALRLAHTLMLDSLIRSNPDPKLRQRYNWALVDINQAQYRAQHPEPKLKTYVGQYGPRKIFLRDGKLYYQRDENPPYTLIWIGENLFELKGMTGFRIQFVEENGKMTRIKGLYENGRVDESPRNQ